MEKKKKIFEEHFAENYRKTYRFVAMRISCREDAEDVTAEALTAAWKSLHTYVEDRAELSTWMISIARFKIVDHWRKKRDLPWDDAFLEIPSKEDASLAHVVDTQQAFARIIDSLPGHLAALLAFRHIDGLSCEEIATIVNKSPEAVRQALSRSHRSLAQQFPEYEDLN